MYRIENKTEAIRQVQTFLRAVAIEKQNIPLLSVDGIYGEETADAVRAFQKSRSLSVTGRVNYETFTLLYETYEDIETEKRLSSLSPGIHFPLKKGDMGEGVYLLHLLLRDLRLYYPDLGRVPLSSVYSSDTEAAVRYLESVFSEKSDGTVSRRLYFRMVTELAARRAAAETKFFPLA